MKCSELYRLLKKNGWYPVSQKGSHIKLRNDRFPGRVIIFPDHGQREIGKGLENKLLKDAGLKEDDQNEKVQ
jgi:predicted RNA binding protein YcfA (HicA-like mRNA interferase family)